MLLSVWKSDEKLLSFASSLKNHFIILSIRHYVSSPNETPQTVRRSFSFHVLMITLHLMLDILRQDAADLN